MRTERSWKGCVQKATFRHRVEGQVGFWQVERRKGAKIFHLRQPLTYWVLLWSRHCAKWTLSYEPSSLLIPRTQRKTWKPVEVRLDLREKGVGVQTAEPLHYLLSWVNIFLLFIVMSSTVLGKLFLKGADNKYLSLFTFAKFLSQLLTSAVVAQKQTIDHM